MIKEMRMLTLEICSNMSSGAKHETREFHGFAAPHSRENRQISQVAQLIRVNAAS